jgi:hypothetical protein
VGEVTCFFIYSGDRFYGGYYFFVESVLADTCDDEAGVLLVLVLFDFGFLYE